MRRCGAFSKKKFRFLIFSRDEFRFGGYSGAMRMTSRAK
jgi:hypothetical protein